MPIMFVLIKRTKSSFAKNIAILIVLALFFSGWKNEIKISNQNIKEKYDFNGIDTTIEGVKNSKSWFF